MITYIPKFLQIVFLNVIWLVILVSGGCKLESLQATQKLHQAVLAGKTKAVERYVKKGANTNYWMGERGWTPLLLAAEAGHTGIAKVLIDAGADVNYVSVKDKVSPLQRASARGNLEMVKLLLEHEADIDYQDEKLRSTPLMWACVNGHEEVARFLLENKALINVRGNRGESALFLAVSAERVALVKLLLSYKANKDRVDIYGKTPLQKAEELKNQEIINLLNDNQR